MEMPIVSCRRLSVAFGSGRIDASFRTDPREERRVGPRARSMDAAPIANAKGEFTSYAENAD